MSELRFLVEGNANKHEVIVRKKDKNMTVLCSCAKGVSGLLCKHKLSILTGKSEGIISDNAGEVRRVLHWFEGSDVGDALFRLKDATLQLEADKNRLKADKEKLALAKRILAEAIND